MLAAGKVFGGGNLGMGEEAWNLLDRLCRFDYMGAAEYEFGAVREAFDGLITRPGGLTSFSQGIGPQQRKLSYKRGYSRETLPPAKNVVVFGIYPAKSSAYYHERVLRLVEDEGPFSVKGGAAIAESFDPITYSGRTDYTVGWLEIDNGFMFFSDETMWRGFCELFSVTPCGVPEVEETVNYASMKKPDLVKAAVNLGVCRTKSEANRIKKGELVTLLSV